MCVLTKEAPVDSGPCLKGVKKGTKVLMLDANGGDAAKVAKALATQGFGKVYVIQGVGPGGCCLPRHPTHCEPSSVKLT